jgi:hypothetical protein
MVPRADGACDRPGSRTLPPLARGFERALCELPDALLLLIVVPVDSSHVADAVVLQSALAVPASLHFHEASPVAARRQTSRPGRRVAMGPSVLVTTGAGSMFMPAPSASVFPVERVRRARIPWGWEVFGIAHRACSCTPPRRRRSWMTPHSRGASPGTRVEGIATVGAT